MGSFRETGLDLPDSTDRISLEDQFSADKPVRIMRRISHFPGKKFMLIVNFSIPNSRSSRVKARMQAQRCHVRSEDLLGFGARTKPTFPKSEPSPKRQR